MADSSEELLRKRGWSMQSEGSAPQREELHLNGGSEPLVSDSSVNGAAVGVLNAGSQEPSNSETRHKRPRTEPENSDDNSDGETDAKKPRILQLAKQRLSKWAARLFDPDRPKGQLIEPPEIIPLNDTFLSAFGKREKEHDSRHGISLQIETADDEHDRDSDSDDKVDSSAGLDDAALTKANAFFKVKIANLKFTTTDQTLQNACRKYGEVQSLVLAMDPDNKSHNKGRAVVTFVQEAAALECIDKLLELDGRKLRVTAANAPTTNTNASTAASRYYSVDISTKCFRCGQVGHYSDSCPNERLVKPCAICSKTDHDIRDCPSRNVCFNCGIPGHVVRDCSLPRGQPQRRICTICFFSGHSKEQCRYYNNGIDVAAQALCMICGVPGHFMCRDMQWYFGLRGVSCYNCGRTGHLGGQCDRPRLEDCWRNESVAVAEVERAATWTFAEDEINGRRQESRGRPQERQHTRFDSDSRRHQSLPPPPRGRGQRHGDQQRQPERGQASSSSTNGRNGGQDKSQQKHSSKSPHRNSRH